MQHQTSRLPKQKLLDILRLSQNAAAIYIGTDLLVEYANAGMISYWGKDKQPAHVPGLVLFRGHFPAGSVQNFDPLHPGQYGEYFLFHLAAKNKR